MAVTLLGDFATLGSKNEKAGIRRVRKPAFINALIADVLAHVFGASAACGQVALYPASGRAI
jgi:hypothetical protein